MPVRAIVGGQWGDEGKGKIVDYLARDASIVARYSGGNNAGHTVKNDLGEFTFQIVPCGVCWPGTINVIGNGVVVNPEVLINELRGMEQRGLPGRVVVSDRAHLIMPYHVRLDQLEEKRRGKSAIGTTGSGIGPAYADKVGRCGIRAGQLLELENLLLALPEAIEFKNEVITKIYGGEPIDVDTVVNEVRDWATQLAPYIGPTEEILSSALENDQTVLLEGAQGTLLDLDHGTYPYVTSSSPTAGGMLSGLGIGFGDVEEAIGVFKAYSTRVGAGPFPTQVHGEIADQLRGDRSDIDGEYGTVTRRSRRIGWFDAVAARHSVRTNGLSSIVLTRLDTLDGMDEINVCIEYELDGSRISRFPSDAAALNRCRPIYERMGGWSESTRGSTDIGGLPFEAREYVRSIEEILSTPVKFVSTGPHRDETISLESALV